MPSKYTTLMEFRAHGGTVYELCLGFDAVPTNGFPEYLWEDHRGLVFPGSSTEVRDAWGSLIEMTHGLKVEILSWGSDVGN